MPSLLWIEHGNIYTGAHHPRDVRTSLRMIVDIKKRKSSVTHVISDSSMSLAGAGKTNLDVLEQYKVAKTETTMW